MGIFSESIGINCIPVAQFTQKSTALEESAVLGSEITDSSGWTSTGWAGSYNSFTHNTGNTTALSRTMTTSNGQKYQISWVVTGRTAGSFTVTLGTVALGSISATGNTAPTTTANGNLIFTPTTDFNGTISSISVKQITGISTPIYSILDSNEISTFEIRNYLSTSFNLFIGKNSGGYNTTGVYNTGIGNNAMALNTSGYENFALGASSLYANTTGYRNVGIGINSLYSNKNGFLNTSIGGSSLYNNTNGQQNTAIGAYSMSNNTIGFLNTCIGTYSFSNNISGNFNVAIGNNTGIYHADGTTALATATNSVYIGYACRGFNNSDSNSIVIGANAIGLGANSTMIGTSATVTTAIYGKLGVGTITPKSALDVAGGIRCADDTAVASADKAGTFRYRTSGNNSYTDICMQTGAATYEWTEIVRHSW